MKPFFDSIRAARPSHPSSRAVIDARYEDVTEVASGSMGTVFRARDRCAASRVALKLLDQPSMGQRFVREAHLLSKIRHPNLVEYLAHGTTSAGQPWIAMEWLEGEDLAARLRRGPLGVAETLVLATALSAGLACLHARGVVHRDLKPSNVFVPRGDLTRAKVLDFGLAREAGESEAITSTGTLLGTVEYMAPEQAVDARCVDARADVFSLGVLLYECLTRCSPFDADMVHEVLARIASVEVPPVRRLRPEVPPRLEALITSMLMKDPHRRPKDGAEVAASLAAIVRESPPPPNERRRAALPRWLAVGVLGLALTTLLGAELTLSIRGASRFLAPRSADRARTLVNPGKGALQTLWR